MTKSGLDCGMSTMSCAETRQTSARAFVVRSLARAFGVIRRSGGIPSRGADSQYSTMLCINVAGGASTIPAARQTRRIRRARRRRCKSSICERYFENFKPFVASTR